MVHALEDLNTCMFMLNVQASSMIKCMNTEHHDEITKHTNISHAVESFIFVKWEI